MSRYNEIVRKLNGLSYRNDELGCRIKALMISLIKLLFKYLKKLLYSFEPLFSNGDIIKFLASWTLRYELTSSESRNI